MAYRFTVTVAADHALNRTGKKIERTYDFATFNMAMGTMSDFRDAGFIVEVPEEKAAAEWDRISAKNDLYHAMNGG